MPTPPFQSYFLPLLKLAEDGQERSFQSTVEELAQRMGLSELEASELVPSGVQTKHSNRVSWAKTFLTKAKLLESTGRAKFKITKRGLDLLGENPLQIDNNFLKRYPEFVEFKYAGGGAQAGTDKEVVAEMPETPEERLESDYQEIRSALAENLLQVLASVTPVRFEEIVIQLLLAMGYGGSRSDAGKAIGKTGDGGIDGIINEDRLGLDVIYVQAKRWTASVGRPEVQAFAGSLLGRGASKGVMITTSKFTAQAFEFVQHLVQKIILIDGEKLAELLIDFDVGVAVTKSYSVKRIDLEYFGVS
jgi:restriction system protein